MKDHKLFNTHKVPKQALEKERNLKKKESLDEFAKVLESAKREESETKKLSLLSKAYQATSTIEEKIYVYKQGKGELGQDIFFKNIKNDLLKTNSIDNLNKMFWKGGKSLSNEAAQKLEKLGHKDGCKCETCSKYHKNEVVAIKSALKKAKVTEEEKKWRSEMEKKSKEVKLNKKTELKRAA